LRVLDTERLTLRHLASSDDAFILELLNDPDWVRYIGDRGVRNLEDARAYIQKGPMAMYRRYGLGLYLVVQKVSGAPIGMCGLLKRDALPDADIGFAFLPGYRGRGYALEAARAVIDDAVGRLGLARILALVSPGNESSERLLGKLGMRFEKMIRLPGQDHDVQLFSTDAVPAESA